MRFRFCKNIHLIKCMENLKPSLIKSCFNYSATEGSKAPMFSVSGLRHYLGTLYKFELILDFITDIFIKKQKCSYES